MAVSLSTFAQTEQKMDAVESQAATQTSQETSETTVNEEGTLENVNQETSSEQHTETQTTEQTSQEENTSEFKIGLEEDTTNQQTQQSSDTNTSQPTFNLDEEIKKVDRKELLKKLGVNDFTIEMDDYLAKGGKADDYISKRGIDWNKVSDEDIVKADLRAMYGGDVSTQQLDRLYNKKYNQTEIDGDEDKEDGLLLMRAEAKRIREQKIAEQNNFKIPDAIIPPPTYEAEYLEWKQQRETQPALMKQLNDFYQNHEATKALNESKRVTINLGEGVPPFNFLVNNPNAITRMYTDGGESWQKITSTQTGEPDVPKQNLIGLFSHNPQKFIQDIFNYGKQMGVRSKVEEGQNAQRPQQKTIPAELNGQASYSTGKFGDKQRF